MLHFTCESAKHNNAPFHLKLLDGTIKNIRLQALTQEQADIATKIAASAKPPTLSQTYTVASPAPSINGFYGSNQYTVLNQEDFGTCVTFSSTAALSYLTTGTTTNISPLYLLDQGYMDEDGFENSGWDGLKNAGTLLRRLLPNYDGKPAKNQGYYPNYALTENTYNRLSNEYKLSGEEGELTPAQLHKSGFYKQQFTYHAMSSNTPAILFNNVIASNLNVTTGSPNNAQLVKQALDKGHLVLLDVSIYDAAVPAGKECTKNNVTTGGTAQYTYDSSTATLTQTPEPTAVNTWASATGCLLGGHQIWATSYATDSAGHLMFVIRNSWGAQAGDQGQYYMSESYLNNAVAYAAELSLSK